MMIKQITGLIPDQLSVSSALKKIKITAFPKFSWSPDIHMLPETIIQTEISYQSSQPPSLSSFKKKKRNPKFSEFPSWAKIQRKSQEKHKTNEIQI